VGAGGLFDRNMFPAREDYLKVYLTFGERWIIQDE
jgi:hypothetical protein